MSSKMLRGLQAAGGALLLSAIVSATAIAQAPPAGAAPGGAGGPGAGMGAGGAPGGGMQMPSPAEQAISYRKALFDVISGNFSPIGGVLQGRAEFNGADAAKRAERLAQLAVMLDDAFPDISKTGNTKSLEDIWTKRAEFDKLSKDFVDHTAALAAVLKKDKTNSAEFKAAATAVAQDCQTCHKNFRAR
ncbi:MAG: cytochrome c [Steroidobacteraceae bacterium]